MNDSTHPNPQLGNYHLLRPLGHGMSSHVYLAERQGQPTPVAIKVLDGYQDQTEVERFLARASVLTHLSHPHIVSVLDYGIEGSTAFLVMRYLPHGTLRDRHPRGTRLPLATIMPYVEQVTDALQYVHQHQLIHRDVKPHNLLLGASGDILLSDFGIAIVSQSHMPVYPVFHDFEGTAPYAAPEQLQGKPRRSSDQYALAVVIYEWLAGDWPFSGTFEEIIQQHLFVPPPPLREKGVAVPPAVEQVILRALSKEPEQRFPSISAFGEALKQAQAINSTPNAQFKSPLPFVKDI